MLLEKTIIATLVKNLSEFQNVASGQLIIISNKNTSKKIKTQWFENGFGDYSLLEQSRWNSKENHYQFFLHKNDKESGIIEKIKTKSKPIEHYFPKKLIRTGESIGVKESGFVTENKADNPNIEVYEYLEGGKSLKGQYEPLKPTRYFNYDVDLLDAKNLSYRIEAKKITEIIQKFLGLVTN